tara:strand:+ start:8536 stop:9252 length:717 start_codon:yes stop_codon:yes gene_type:complete
MKKVLKKIVLSNQILTRISHYLLRLILKTRKDLIIGKKVIIGFSSTFGGQNYIGKNTTFTSSEIGFASYIAEFSYFMNAKIGKYSSIGPHVKCIFGNHPTHTFVSTHPSFFSTRKQVGFSFTEKQLFQEFALPKEENAPYTIEIGNDVWIGANVSILDGVSIGNGAIVAANSLVNKDIPPYSIYGGVPAKLIKPRFDHEKVAYLINLSWWDKPYEWIKAHSHLFVDIDMLMKNIKSNE